MNRETHSSEARLTRIITKAPLYLYNRCLLIIVMPIIIIMLPIIMLITIISDASEQMETCTWDFNLLNLLEYATTGFDR